MKTLDQLYAEAEKELELAKQNLQEAWKHTNEARKMLYQPKDIYNN